MKGAQACLQMFAILLRVVEQHAERIEQRLQRLAWPWELNSACAEDV